MVQQLVFQEWSLHVLECFPVNQTTVCLSYHFLILLAISSSILDAALSHCHRRTKRPRSSTRLAFLGVHLPRSNRTQYLSNFPKVRVSQFDEGHCSGIEEKSKPKILPNALVSLFVLARLLSESCCVGIDSSDASGGTLLLLYNSARIVFDQNEDVTSVDPSGPCDP